ncbi:hypothetical protein [Sphaerisporangium flaviroseum]|uniref:hypothetical protein n=1 Tax=Sphaerisporangium flaviroseum TaxID=509199 RepID=UPI0031ECADA0
MADQALLRGLADAVHEVGGLIGKGREKFQAVKGEIPVVVTEDDYGHAYMEQHQARLEAIDAALGFLRERLQEDYTQRLRQAQLNYQQAEALSTIQPR